METISNMAYTAANAVWGDNTNHTEPVSGVQGDVSKGEPYDAGNSVSTSKESRRRDSKLDAETEHLPSKDGAADRTHADHELESSKVTKPEAEAEAEAEAKADVATESSTKEPADGPKKSSVDETEDAQNEESVMGDGPKPLATIAKENGGDAGNLGSTHDSTSEKVDPADEQAVKEEAKSKGTGEEYVKTSGLAADGGDFDATKPGAGREADRLMEEKGMRREGGDSPSKSDSTPAAKNDDVSVDGKDKPSLKERIKEKLHIHKSGKEAPGATHVEGGTSDSTNA